jgi:hypothetical protein
MNLPQTSNSDASGVEHTEEPLLTNTVRVPNVGTYIGMNTGDTDTTAD